MIYDSTWRKDVAHNKSGKVGREKAGKRRNCLNLKDEASDKIKWYDFRKDVEEWSLVVEEELEELLLTENCQDKNSVTLIFTITRTKSAGKSNTLDTGTRLLGNAAFVRIYIRFSKDFPKISRKCVG